MAKRRVGRYTNEFKRMCVERMKQCDDIVALSKELDIHRRLLYRWRDQLDPVEKGEWPPPQNSREPTLRKEVSRLKRVLADKTLELDSKVPCKKSSPTPAERRLWREGIYDQIREVMSLQGSMSIERMCQLAQVIQNISFEVYLNLASRMKLTGINQLWVADITYIRLKTEFVYLGVILDGFSRKVVSWFLERTLATRLPRPRWKKPSLNVSHPQAWSITPIAGCNTLLKNTCSSC